MALTRDPATEGQPIAPGHRFELGNGATGTVDSTGPDRINGTLDNGQKVVIHTGGRPNSPEPPTTPTEGTTPMSEGTGDSGPSIPDAAPTGTGGGPDIPTDEGGRSTVGGATGGEGPRLGSDELDHAQLEAELQQTRAAMEGIAGGLKQDRERITQSIPLWEALKKQIGRASSKRFGSNAMRTLGEQSSTADAAQKALKTAEEAMAQAEKAVGRFNELVPQTMSAVQEAAGTAAGAVAGGASA